MSAASRARERPLPEDFPPPIDLRWPEYIQTQRGAEWWIPTPAVGAGAGDPL
jgi:aminobenzoyl-glutamate utilization protein B